MYQKPSLGVNVKLPVELFKCAGGGYVSAVDDVEH